MKKMIGSPEASVFGAYIYIKLNFVSAFLVLVKGSLSNNSLEEHTSLTGSQL